MCGIVIRISAKTVGSSTATTELLPTLNILNSQRGPDVQDSLSLEAGSWAIDGFASVLHLRGDVVTKQPHVNAQGDFLCWNGEVFEGFEVSAEQNDGRLLFDRLSNDQDIVDVLSEIEGPYAFVYYKRSHNTLYWGRDPLGRRSLLLHLPTPTRSALILTSVSPGADAVDYQFEEVSPEGIHLLNLDTLSLSDVKLWSRSATHEGPGTDFTRIPDLNNHLPPSDSEPDSAALDAAAAELTAALQASVRLRVQHIPTLLQPGARLAVLFSGGIDCTVLAYLSDKYIPPDEPIDLLNVAFENPRTLKNNKQGTYEVPDRLTGLEEVEELRRTCPSRQWNFIEVDVPYEETTRERPKIEQLMWPNRTVMDLSLALALYFASRGCGTLDCNPYRSQARVLLSGLGSDELLGGYARHRNAFSINGWQGMIDELQLDLTRLPSRNLGRDDRVISSNGKETRYPFLSLSVVNLVAQLPVESKVNPTLGEGRGDKMLLRRIAEDFGLEQASRRKKRAMQFGSRSARMEGGDADKRGDILLSSPNH